jgi:hypothetical protein
MKEKVLYKFILYNIIGYNKTPSNKRRLTMNDQEWFDIPGWEGVYQITRAGQVKRVKLNIIQSRNKKDGTVLDVPKQLKKERVKKWNYYRGHYRVHLTNKEKDKVYLIPELLLLTFHPEIEVDKIGSLSYKDHDPTNVQFSNLDIFYK